MQIPIKLNGNPFNVTFAPDLVDPLKISVKLCQETEKTLQLTQETFPLCISQVSEYFKRVIDEYNDRLSLKVTLTVSGNDFDIRYRPDLVSSETMANKLCIENSNTLGINNETLVNCIKPVKDYLLNAATKFIQSRTIEIPITIYEKDFTLSFRTDLNSPFDVASYLCNQNKQIFGLNDNDIDSKCINPAAEFIQNSIRETLEERAITVPITIDEVSYTMTFQPDIESAKEAVNQLCIGRLKLSDDAIPECAEKVFQYIVDYVSNQYTAAKNSDDSQLQSDLPSTVDKTTTENSESNDNASVDLNSDIVTIVD
eukprot:gene17600-23172_t